MNRKERVMLERSLRTLVEDYIVLVCEQQANTVLLERKLAEVERRKDVCATYVEREPLLKAEGALVCQLNNCRISTIAYQNNADMFAHQEQQLLEVTK
jgi:hypothetical protein